MNKIKKFFQDIVGITEIKKDSLNRDKQLKHQLQLVNERYHQMEESMMWHRKRHQSIEKHLDLIASHFVVAADIEIGKTHSRTNIVTILKNGNDNIVKFFELHDRDIHEINMMLENFQKRNVRIDNPYRQKGPNFRI